MANDKALQDTYAPGIRKFQSAYTGQDYENVVRNFSNKVDKRYDIATSLENNELKVASASSLYALNQSISEQISSNRILEIINSAPDSNVLTNALLEKLNNLDDLNKGVTSNLASLALIDTTGYTGSEYILVKNNGNNHPQKYTWSGTRWVPIGESEFSFPVAAPSTVVVYSQPVGTYDVIKALIKLKDSGGNVHGAEVMIATNGTIVDTTVYASVYNASSLFTITGVINAGMIEIEVNANTAGTIEGKILAEL